MPTHLWVVDRAVAVAVGGAQHHRGGRRRLAHGLRAAQRRRELRLGDAAVAVGVKVLRRLGCVFCVLRVGLRIECVFKTISNNAHGSSENSQLDHRKRTTAHTATRTHHYTRCNRTQNNTLSHKP